MERAESGKDTTADRQAELDYIQQSLPSYAKGDYSFSPAAVQLVIDTVKATDFDDSPEGVWRRTVSNPEIDPSRLYTNRFVNEAMRQ